MLTDPSELNDDCMSVLEAFVVLLYDRTCTETTVNLARKHILTTKGRSMDNLPPARAALLQHTQNEQYTRVDMCGGRHSSVVHLFPLHKHRVGRRVRGKDGNRSGHCCQKRWPHVLIYLNVDARKGVGDYANVSGMLSNVHHSVTAVGTATTMIAIRYQLCDNPYRSAFFIL